MVAAGATTAFIDKKININGSDDQSDCPKVSSGSGWFWIV
jgi:hypothetical protein